MPTQEEFVMKSSFSLNNQVSSSPNPNSYLHTLTQWLPQTPERALEQAYQAALKIAKLENDHFNSGEAYIKHNHDNETSYKTALLQTEFNKNLAIIKLRLAEFKTSYAIFTTSQNIDAEKLQYIDWTLKKYDSQNQKSPSPLIRLFQEGKNHLFSGNNQSSSVTIDIQANQAVPKKGIIMARSINETFNRVKTELDPKSEVDVIRNFRASKYKTRIAVRFILLLIVIPLVTQQISKQFLVHPIVNQIRGAESQVFLNSEMKEDALKELHSYEEELKFESLVNPSPELSSEVIEEKVKHKAAGLVKEFHAKSNDAISNVFADLFGTLAFTLVLLTNRKQVLILKDFLGNILTGLSDSTKAFLLILLTDMFVGFHSPHGWEVLLEGLASHLGLPASKTWISLFIATVPVMMDTVFKYWIFRYMARLSPSAFATMKTMNE